MKSIYPKYKESGISGDKLYKKLDSKDKIILDEFLKYCSISAGANKIRDIRLTLTQFRDITQKPYKEIILKDLREFLAILEQSNKTEWTKNGIKNYLKRFYKWMFKDWSDRFDNFRDIKLRNAFNQKKINEGTLITPEELKALCHTAKDYRDKALVMTLYETGARPQEIRNLKWKDLIFNDDGTIKVSLYSGKTSTARTILIKDSRIVLEDWRQHYYFLDRTEHDYVFPSKLGKDKPISDGNFSLIFARLGKETKLSRPLFPYLFRHTRLTELHKLLPEQIHKKYAGHTKDSRMTAVYSHISSDDVTQSLLSKVYKIERLSPEQKTKLEMEVENLKQEYQKQEATIYELIRLLQPEQNKANYQKLLAVLKEKV